MQPMATDLQADDMRLLADYYAGLAPPQGEPRTTDAVLIETGADSVQSYVSVGKHHPCWMVALEAGHRVQPYRQSTIDRRQDLPRLLVPDGGGIAAKRTCLLEGPDDQPHAFLGTDRRGFETTPGSVVDVDTAADLLVAEAILAEAAQGAAR